MSIPLCQHIRLNGSRCGSPALRDRQLCYYHHAIAIKHEPLNPPVTPESLERLGLTTETVRHPTLAEYRGFRPTHPVTLNLPVLEDSASILCATSMLVTALGEYRITPSLATPILYGLQIALATLRNQQSYPALSPDAESKSEELGPVGIVDLTASAECRPKPTGPTPHQARCGRPGNRLILRLPTAA